MKRHRAESDEATRAKLRRMEEVVARQNHEKVVVDGRAMFREIFRLRDEGRPHERRARLALKRLGR